MGRIKYWTKKAILGFFSMILNILAMPQVRNTIWDSAVRKGKEKVVDAEAKIVKE